MKRLKPVLIAVFLLLSAFSVSACGDTKQLVGIEADVSAFKTEQYLGEVTLDGLKLVVKYADGTSVSEPITKDMIQERDAALLETVGEHTFTVRYLGFECTFTLKITEKQPEIKKFEGITFEDAEFVYDGAEKTITVAGAPDFAQIEYENNVGTEAGEYGALAEISAEGYQTLMLSAKLTVLPAEIKGVKFESAAFNFDGEEKFIYATSVPEGASVSYENNGQVEPGIHCVKAIITKKNYLPKVLFAYITIFDTADISIGK